MQFDEQIYLKGFLKQMKFKTSLFQNEVPFWSLKNDV